MKNRSWRLSITLTFLLGWGLSYAVNTWLQHRANHSPLKPFSVRPWIKDKSLPGCNLVLPVEGYAPVKVDFEPQVFLLAMDGRLVHSWSLPSYAHSARLLPNGRLWVIHRDIWNGKEVELLRLLDWDGREIVRIEDPSSHHSMDAIDEDRVVYPSVRRLTEKEVEQYQLPRYRIAEERRHWHTDSLIIRDIALDKRVWEYDLLSELKPDKVSEDMKFTSKLFHINSVQYLPKNPLTQVPAILFSARNLNQMFIVEIESRKIIWRSPLARGGGFHDAQMLKDGSVLAFENAWQLGTSGAIKFDPRTQKLVRKYGFTPDLDFFSPYNGAVQELRNGNWLITDSSWGHAFEIDLKGQIIWEFFWGRPHSNNYNPWPWVSLNLVRRYYPQDIKPLSDLHENCI